MQSFETRNQALWSSIEASILEAEREEEGKRRVLEDNRKRREEAERKAKEMREMEERKVKEDHERKEKEKLEKEKKDQEERHKQEEIVRIREKEQEERDEHLAVIAPATGKGIEGSPQADWEKWTDLMTVSRTARR